MRTFIVVIKLMANYLRQIFSAKVVATTECTVSWCFRAIKHSNNGLLLPGGGKSFAAVTSDNKLSKVRREHVRAQNEVLRHQHSTYLLTAERNELFVDRLIDHRKEVLTRLLVLLLRSHGTLTRRSQAATAVAAAALNSRPVEELVNLFFFFNCSNGINSIIVD